MIAVAHVDVRSVFAFVFVDHVELVAFWVLWEL